jgi:hypothetical protein
MNFSSRLCTLVLLVFSYTLQVKAVVYTDEDIQSIATKIEQGNKLDEDEVRKLKTLNEKYPGLLTENMFKQLRSSGKLRSSGNSSSKRGALARRTNTARKLRNILTEQAEEHAQLNKNNLVSLVSQLTEDLEKAHYTHIQYLVQDCLKQINTLEIHIISPEHIASALRTALEYGIPDIVEYLINNGLLITETDIAYLTEVEAEELDVDCAWFKSGADFEKCRQLLEAALTA